MKVLILLSAIVMSSNAWTSETRTIEQLLNESKLEKIQVETMVETMVKSGRLTEDQGEVARRGIASVHEEDQEMIKQEFLKSLPSHDIANK